MTNSLEHHTNLLTHYKNRLKEEKRQYARNKLSVNHEGIIIFNRLVARQEELVKALKEQSQ